MGGGASPQPPSSPLVLAQSFVLWAGQAVPYVRAFPRKVLSLSISFFFFLSGYPTVWVVISFAPSDCPQGIRPSPYPKLAACASLFSTHSLLVDSSIWATSLLGVVVRCIICGLFIYLFIYLFIFSRLCCPLRFQNSPQTCRWEGFRVFGNFSSFMTPSLGWVSFTNSFISLFIFYILSYLFSKKMGCLSGCLVSSANIQFCGICSVFKWSFNEFVGGESGLPILFLCHLRTAPVWCFFLKSLSSIVEKLLYTYINNMYYIYILEILWIFA